MYALCSYQATFPFTFRNIIIHRPSHLFILLLCCARRNPHHHHHDHLYANCPHVRSHNINLFVHQWGRYDGVVQRSSSTIVIVIVHGDAFMNLNCIRNAIIRSVTRGLSQVQCSAALDNSKSHNISIFIPIVQQTTRVIPSDDLKIHFNPVRDLLCDLWATKHTTIDRLYHRQVDQWRSLSTIFITIMVTFDNNR